MTASEKVAAYITKHSKWSEQLKVLREIFRETELIEEVKWGSPTYTLNGKLVAGFAAFKNHYAIWFHQGVFLKDESKKLINAQEGVTRALRQWKFTQEDEIEQEIVESYIKEAIQNSKDGKEIKPERKTKELVVPPELETAMQNDSELKDSFGSLTPGKQREYAAYISEAKRESTKLSRLEKITPMILAKKGLYDKYKNC